jgi:hypothetical protein
MKKAREPLPDLLTDPQFSEKRRQAEAADKKLRNLVASAQEGRRFVQRKCAEQIGAPQERDPNRLVWHGIARFANSSFQNDDDALKGIVAFRSLLILCEIRSPDIGSVVDPVEELSFSDLDQGARRTGQSTGQVLVGRILTLHAQFRLMVAWLAGPSTRSSAQRRQALDFLLEHGAEGTAHSSIDVNDEFSKTGDKGYPLFYWKRIDGYDTIMTPVARFILDRLERYHEGPLELGEAVPLRACRRPECGRFFVPQRTTKDFCTSSCRTLYRQKTKPEAWAAYMRDYRERNYKKPKRRD